MTRKPSLAWTKVSINTSTLLLRMPHEREPYSTGIRGMCANQKRSMIIPPWLGFGVKQAKELDWTDGSTTKIPSHSWLVGSGFEMHNITSTQHTESFCPT